MIASPGALDGRTLLRFVHAFETGGGMERLVDDLDQILLARNALTIVRMHLGRDLDRPERSIRSLGRGRLIRVALPSTPGLESTYADHEAPLWDWRQSLRRHVYHAPLIWDLVVRPWVRRRRLRARPGEMIGAGAVFAALAEEFAFDLCLMHFFGSADAAEVIA